jgi:hypothetical protein
MIISPRRAAFLAALVLAAPAAAQSFGGDNPNGAVAAFRQQVDAIRKTAAAGAPFAPAGAVFARSISCPGTKESPIGKVKIYTSLGFIAGQAPAADGTRPFGAVAGKPEADETRLNDYVGVSVRDGVFQYDATSCDTQDYYLSASVKDLVRLGSGPSSTPVVLHAHVETRGTVDADVDVACTANW